MGAIRFNSPRVRRKKHSQKVAIEGGEPVKLTDQYALYPSASPDGRFVAYFQFSNGSHKHSIRVCSADDMKTVTQMSLAPGSWISSRLHWDAGSRSVSYAIEREGKVRVYEQSLGGGPPRQIASFKAKDEFDFAWSPDRSKLVYMSSKWHHDIVLIGGLTSRNNAGRSLRAYSFAPFKIALLSFLVGVFPN